MTKELTFFQKVAKVQTELKAPKNQTNKFGGYNYRNQEDILEALKPLLQEVGGLVVTVNDEVIFVGNRVYVKSTATITDGTNSVSNSAFAREPEEQKGMSAGQLTGATSSYARKYALNGLFLIDDTKDLDTNEFQDKTRQDTKSSSPVKETSKANATSSNVKSDHLANAGPNEPTTEQKMVDANSDNKVNSVPPKKGWGANRAKKQEPSKEGDLY